MDCNGCEKNAIPFVAHEKDMARMERSNKRLFALCVILAILLTVSVLYVVYLKSEYQQVITTEQEVEQNAEGDGDIQFVGGDYYGE